jgi:hypothetical protein
MQHNHPRESEDITTQQQKRSNSSLVDHSYSNQVVQHSNESRITIEDMFKLMINHVKHSDETMQNIVKTQNKLYNAILADKRKKKKKISTMDNISSEEESATEIDDDL